MSAITASPPPPHIKFCPLWLLCCKGRQCFLFFKKWACSLLCTNARKSPSTPSTPSPPAFICQANSRLYRQSVTPQIVLGAETKSWVMLRYMNLNPTVWQAASGGHEFFRYAGKISLKGRQTTLRTKKEHRISQGQSSGGFYFMRFYTSLFFFFCYCYELGGLYIPTIFLQ